MHYSIKIYLLKIPKDFFGSLWIILLIYVWTRKHIFAQLNNNNQTERNLIITSIKPNIKLVDQIETIDVTANQLVITTSKAGSSETMKLSIQVVDIQTGLELPPFNITGILLILTRGRYTVNFLIPNRWYGILFRCEQQYGGILGPVYVNEENHLIKTHKEDGSNFDKQAIMKIFTKRNGKEGKSLENLLITMKWEVSLDERTNIDVVTNITLHCKEQIRFKQLRLYGREMEKSMEVKLENNFEIIEIYNETRQIIASITPKNCPRICWNAKLISETNRGFTFQRNAAQNCEDILPVTSITTLRDYLSYEAHSTDLIVHTNYINPNKEENNREADAYVEISAIPIPESTNQENVTNKYKIFRTKNEENDFKIDYLEPNTLYAVEYRYEKESPFVYSESRRFVIETNDFSKSQSLQPIKLELEPIMSNYNDENLLNNANSYIQNVYKNYTVQITIKLNSKFKKYKIRVDIDPFCDSTINNGSHFWLTKEEPNKEIKNLPIIEVLCSDKEMQEKYKSLCDNQPKINCLISPEICYTTNILLEEKIFSMNKDCLNLFKSYSIQNAIIKTQKDNLIKQLMKDNSAHSNLINFFLLKFVLFYFLFISLLNLK